MNKEDRIEVELNQEEIQTIIDCYEKDVKYIKQLEQEKKELHNKIDKAIDLLQQYLPNYASCIKLLDELEEILKDSNVNE